MPEAQCYTARRLVRKRSLSPPFSAAGQSAYNAMEQIVTHPFGTLVGAHSCLTPQTVKEK